MSFITPNVRRRPRLLAWVVPNEPMLAPPVPHDERPDTAGVSRTGRVQGSEALVDVFVAGEHDLAAVVASAFHETT